MLDIKRNLIHFLYYINSKVLDSEDILKVLEEIDSACNTSLDILNDLLTYEKLDAGILILEKKAIPAFSMLTNCIRPFLLHVYTVYILHDIYYNKYICI